MKTSMITNESQSVGNEKNNLTLVTGLWDIGRSNLTEGWSRSFDHYLEKFKQLLMVDVNMIIFGDSELEKFVFELRNKENTQFIKRDVSWFIDNDYYQLIQEIRKNPGWYNLSGWLADSTQARLEMYNPLVMSKMFLLHDAKILDRFDSSHLMWIDAGITNTVHYGYFTHDNVLEKMKPLLNKFTFVAFPYDGKVEIHGFEYKKICEYSESEVNFVCRGGFFGGPKESIGEVNSLYYEILLRSLKEGYMGTEESIFTIMAYKFKNKIQYFEIDGNGLLSKFFEDCKNETLQVKQNSSTEKSVALYILTFNSPNQVQTLLDSMYEYDENFIKFPQIILLDNSTDLSTQDQYLEICNRYNIIHIKKDNLGICGGRQFIAEHADENGYDFYFFFEDDMFFYPRKGEVCRNGFNRWVPDLYFKVLDIMQSNSYDFLKLSFSEFFGDNKTQWAWYNVPQSIREEYWPENPKLPNVGLDPNAPKTKFSNINSIDALPYIDGEIYYSNWPQIISKVGNTKMFLDTKWAHPYEQTWMSHIYQETKKGKIKPAILLLSPTEHNRFDHYSRELRKES